jgi:hypothetical protein
MSLTRQIETPKTVMYDNLGNQPMKVVNREVLSQKKGSTLHHKSDAFTGKKNTFGVPPVS